MFSSVQSLSRIRLCDPKDYSMPGFLSITNTWSLLKLMSIELVMPSNHLILCHPLLFLPSIFPSIVVFSNESAVHVRWPKYWSFSFNISSKNEYSGLLSFRINWFDLLAFQGILKSLFQNHSSKASVLQCSAFFGFPDSAVGKELTCSAGDPCLIPGSRRFTGEGIEYPLQYFCPSLVAQLLKNLPVLRETWV